MPASEHAVARGGLHCGRLRDDRPGPARRRDHLLRHGDGQPRERSASPTPATSWSDHAGCRRPSRSASMACGRRIWRRPPPLGGPVTAARGAHGAPDRRPRRGRRARLPRSGPAAEHGLGLLNPLIDTAALDRELRRLRQQPPAERRADRALGDGARARTARPPPPSRRRRRADHRPGLHRPGRPPRGRSGRRRSDRWCASPGRSAELVGLGCSADWASVAAGPRRYVQHPLGSSNLRESGLTDVRFRT